MTHIALFYFFRTDMDESIVDNPECLSENECSESQYSVVLVTVMSRCSRGRHHTGAVQCLSTCSTVQCLSTCSTVTVATPA